MDHFYVHRKHCVPSAGRFNGEKEHPKVGLCPVTFHEDRLAVGEASDSLSHLCKFTQLLPHGLEGPSALSSAMVLGTE